MTPTHDDILLDSGDVARLLKVTPRTVYGWRQNGEGPTYVKVGSGPNAPIRYRPADVRRFIEERLRSKTK